MHVLVRSTVALLATAALVGAFAPAASAGTPDQARVSIRANGTHAGCGVLIADPASTTCSRWVLTTASLAGTLPIAQMTVEAGNCQRGNGAVYSVLNVILGSPPPYSVPVPNDIALIELTTPITFDASVQPLALPPSIAGNYAGVTATITGWWKTTCGGVLSQSCQSVNMTVITNSQAATMWGAALIHDGNIAVFDPITPTSLKPGSMGAGYCAYNGSDWEVIGLASWGVSNCSPDFPFVGTRVSFYRNWIDSQLLAAGPAVCADPVTTVGASYTPCGCPDMTLSSFGGPPHIPNLGFGLRIENLPLPSGFAVLFLHAAVPLTAGIPKFGGTWYMPPTTPGLELTFFDSTSVGASPCGGTVDFELPLPTSIPSSAVGLVVCAQGVVFCPSLEKGLTNALQFTLN